MHQRWAAIRRKDRLLLKSHVLVGHISPFLLTTQKIHLYLPAFFMQFFTYLKGIMANFVTKQRVSQSSGFGSVTFVFAEQDCIVTNGRKTQITATYDGRTAP